MAIPKNELIALYDRDQRIEVDYPDAQTERLPEVVRMLPPPEHGSGYLLYSCLNEENADAIIQEQIAFFGGQGRDFEWKVYDYDTPPDLKERLASYNFEIGEPEGIMVLAIENAPPILHQPVRHDIRRVTQTEGVETVMDLEREIWGSMPDELGNFLRDMLENSPEFLSLYLAYSDEQPVSVAWAFYYPSGEFASLWGGSTLAEYRGRGFYTSLVAIRLQEAARRGYRYLTVDAGPMSRPILEKLRFRKIATAYSCTWNPPE